MWKTRKRQEKEMEKRKEMKDEKQQKYSETGFVI